MPDLESSTVKDHLLQNLNHVRSCIHSACERSGRDASDVQLVVVSKYRPNEHIQILMDADETHFGESRVQEARKKIPEFESEVSWHLIGQLQTNKAKYLPKLFQWVHSVDREDAVDALDKAYSKHEKKVHVLIQVNIAQEDQKGGCSAEEAPELIKYADKAGHLVVEGLMAMAPYSDNPEDARPHFRNLTKLRDEIAEKTGIALPHLSMGMSGDFEVAIEEGATIIRVGSKLFDLPENLK